MSKVRVTESVSEKDGERFTDGGNGKSGVKFTEEKSFRDRLGGHVLHNVLG